MHSRTMGRAEWCYRWTQYRRSAKVWPPTEPVPDLPRRGWGKRNEAINSLNTAGRLRREALVYKRLYMGDDYRHTLGHFKRYLACARTIRLEANRA